MSPTMRRYLPAGSARRPSRPSRQRWRRLYSRPPDTPPPSAQAEWELRGRRPRKIFSHGRGRAMGKCHKAKFPVPTSPNLSWRERPFRAFADLGAMAQKLIGEHAGNHGFADRNGADSDARIVAASRRDLGLGAGTIDGPARGQNRGGGLDRETRDD